MNKPLDRAQHLVLAGFVRGLELEDPVRLAIARGRPTRQDLLTQAEYARSRKARGLPGGTLQAVRRAIATCRISYWTKAKLLEPHLADAEWQRNTRAGLPTAPAAVGTAQPPAPQTSATLDDGLRSGATGRGGETFWFQVALGPELSDHHIASPRPQAARNALNRGTGEA